MPLFLLPLGVALVFAKLSAEEYGREIVDARLHGERLIPRFESDGGPPRGPGDAGAIVQPGVRDRWLVVGAETWSLRPGPLPGPTAATLRDPELRARLEAGEPAISVDSTIAARMRPAISSSAVSQLTRTHRPEPRSPTRFIG